MTKLYDVIVVGLGPGGAVAACELSRAGFSVLALEAKHHPRYKPCGGCLSLKVPSLLEFDLDGVIEEKITAATLTYRHGQAFTRESRDPMGLMVMRDRFDERLVRQAVAAGTEVREGIRVREVQEREEDLMVRTDHGSWRARTLVGADGANSVVARSVGLHPRIRRAVAIEGELTVDSATQEAFRQRVLIDIGSVPCGYGWIFPKAQHLSVGIAGWDRFLKDPMGCYRRFVEGQGLSAVTREEQVRGHLIPVSWGRGAVVGRRTVLVGDAAGLADPLLGEGIYFAIRSAGLAAASVGRLLHQGRPLTAYRQAIAEELWGEHRWARRVATIVYSAPRLAHTLGRQYPAVLETYLAVLGGRASCRALWRSLLVNLPRMASAAVSLLWAPSVRHPSPASRTG